MENGRENQIQPSSRYYFFYTRREYQITFGHGLRVRFCKTFSLKGYHIFPNRVQVTKNRKIIRTMSVYSKPERGARSKMEKQIILTGNNLNV